MGKASPAISNFNGGEFAPQMEGRSDAEKYAVAAHIQQNMIALKQGPSTFRQGTAYAQEVKDSSHRSWLQRFEFSQTQAYQLEFGDGYVRFYTNHGPLLSTGVAAYNNGTAYDIGDQSLLGGIVYYCVAPTTGNAPPTTTYWYPMAPYNGSATTAIYEIPSPYAATDLTDALGEFALQIQQSGDVLYIAGGAAGSGYSPYTLTRFANAPPNWQFASYAPADGPFSDPIPLTPGTNIALVASAVSGSGVTFQAYGGNVFAPTDVGRLIRIASQIFNVTPWQNGVAWSAGNQCSNNGQNYTALNSATSGGSPPVHTAGSVLDGPSGVRWLWTDSGYGIARITGYTNAQQVTTTVLKTLPQNVVGGSAAITGITQAYPAVVTAMQSFLIGSSVMAIGVAGMTPINGTIYSIQAQSGTTVTLAAVNSTNYGAYASGGTLIANATTEWQLGAWSNTTEWPRACAFFKDRLFWAGRLKVFGSVPGEYTSHTPDEFGQETTDSAINILGSKDGSPICWLLEGIILLVGTEGGEYGIDAANYSTSPLGPANIENLRQSRWRCRPIAAELIGTSVLYVQRAGRKVFAMDYNFYLNRYDSSDQSKFAYHITIGGITAIAYQQEPWSLLWAARTDGTLLSYTFNREDQVTAWCRHNVGGNGIVESISVMPAPDASRDELWMIVRRTVSGRTVRTVEYLVKHYEGPQAGYAGDPQSSCWYVDCGVQLISTPAPGATTTQITGIPAILQGQEVAILADGGVQPRMMVPLGGVLTLPGAFTTVTLGLPYQGNLVPMRPEGGAQTGTAQGKRKEGTDLVLRLIDSAGGTVSQLSNQVNGVYQDPLGQTSLTPVNPEPIRYNDTSTALDSPPPIQSGDFPLSFPHAAASDQDERDFYILVQQPDPLPMTVAGLYPNYKVIDP